MDKKRKKSCPSATCSASGIEVTTDRDDCLFCGVELKTNIIDQLFGDMFGGRSPFEGL